MFLSISLLSSLFAIAHSTPQIGSFNIADLHPWYEPSQKNAKIFDISCHPLGANAAVAVALTAFSMGPPNGHPQGAAYANSLKPNGAGFTVHLDAYDDTQIPYAEAGWFGVGGSDAVDYQMGAVSLTVGDVNQPFDPALGTFRVPFAKPFSQTPNVVVFANSIDQLNGNNWRFQTYVESVDPQGFTTHLNTWGDTKMKSAGTNWIAYPATKKLVASGTDSSWNYRLWWVTKPQP